MPVALREAMLYVRVLQPALRYELEQISKSEILRKLKQRFGAKTRAFFNESNLGLEKDWFFCHKSCSNTLIDKLAMSYAVIHDAYDEHSSLNNLGQTALITYCRAVRQNWCLGFQTSDTCLRVDTQKSSNTLAFGPRVTVAESYRLATQLRFVVGWSTYFTPSRPLTSLNGFTYPYCNCC